MSWGQPARPAVTNPNNDFVVANPPNDGVSSLEWSPTGNFLVATAWDGDVRDFARERFDFRDARRETCEGFDAWRGHRERERRD